MTEKISINGKDVWVVVEPYHVHRDNPRTIPTEYFTVRYHFDEPGTAPGELVIEGDSPRLFESPVAALEFANKRLGDMIHRLG